MRPLEGKTVVSAARETKTEGFAAKRLGSTFFPAFHPYLCELAAVYCQAFARLLVSHMS